MQKSINELNEIKASFEKLDIQIKAKMEDQANQPSEIEKTMYEMVSHIHRRINYMQEDLYNYTSKHAKGHLPPITDAGRMEECLKKLGLGDSFQVIKPVIYASVDRRGTTMEFEYTKDAKTV